MKIAVASDGLVVSSYFEHCTNFNYFCIDNGELTNYRNLPIILDRVESAGIILRDLGIDTIIVGCISEKSQKTLESQGFTVFAGAMGDAKKNVEAYITNTFISSDEACVGYDDDLDGEILWDMTQNESLSESFPFSSSQTSI